MEGKLMSIPAERTQAQRDEFRKELERLINRCNVENWSNTPDFILADYVVACLDAMTALTVARDKWYSVELVPGGSRFLYPPEPKTP